MKSAWAALAFLTAAGTTLANSADAQSRAPAALTFAPSRDPVLLGRPSSPTPIRSDAWLAEDKLRHAGASAAIQLMGFGLLRLAGVSARASLVGATLVTVAAGVGKEIYDARGGGDPSARDLVWDGIGIVAGTGLARLGDGR